jgi:hypothetical protein
MTTLKDIKARVGYSGKYIEEKHLDAECKKVGETATAELWECPVGDFVLTNEGITFDDEVVRCVKAELEEKEESAE